MFGREPAELWVIHVVVVDQPGSKGGPPQTIDLYVSENTSSIGMVGVLSKHFVKQAKGFESLFPGQRLLNQLEKLRSVLATKLQKPLMPLTTCSSGLRWQWSRWC